MADELPVLALVRDMMFAGRISATARAEGVSLKLLREPKQLETEAGRFLIVDLNQPGTIAAAANWQRRTGKSAIGFVSHVDASTIDEARQAGINQILPRSRFVEDLPNILKAKE